MLILLVGLVVFAVVRAGRPRRTARSQAVADPAGPRRAGRPPPTGRGARPPRVAGPRPLREWLRAAIATIEDRGVLDPRPGRTGRRDRAGGRGRPADARRTRSARRRPPSTRCGSGSERPPTPTSSSPGPRPTRCARRGSRSADQRRRATRCRDDRRPYRAGAGGFVASGVACRALVARPAGAPGRRGIRIGAEPARARAQPRSDIGQQGRQPGAQRAPRAAGHHVAGRLVLHGRALDAGRHHDRRHLAGRLLHCAAAATRASGHRLVAVTPSPDSLDALAPGRGQQFSDDDAAVSPDCGWPGAAATGSVDFPAGADVYTGSGQLLRRPGDHHRPAGDLGRDRDADERRPSATAISPRWRSTPSATTARSSTVVWLLPGADAEGPGPPSVWSIFPPWIGRAVWQLALIGLLVAFWRGRRLGPVVSEPLPVVVRAAEVVEGHGRLYLRAAARDRAAAALRAGTAAPAGRVGCTCPTRPRRRRGRGGARTVRRPSLLDHRVAGRRRRACSTGPAAAPNSRTAHRSNGATSRDRASRPDEPPSRRIRAEVAKAVIGQDAAVTGVLIGLLCRGHVLLEGVPGRGQDAARPQPGRRPSICGRPGCSSPPT